MLRQDRLKISDERLAGPKRPYGFTVGRGERFADLDGGGI